MQASRARRELTLALLTVVLASCASEADPSRSPAQTPVIVEAEPGAGADDQDPTRVMAELEDRMIAASRVEFEFSIESEGALISSLSGRVRWRRDGEVSLSATGEFAGQPQQLELRGDATTLTTIVAGSERWTGARPPELIEALVLGLTHMGLLHNLAVLTGGMPPDHADAGAREWLATDDLELGPPESRAGTQASSLEFVIVVAGQAVGRATLWLDADGLPIERRQSVEFPTGEMRVIERYANFVIE
ncbi:hypothetical protein ACNOYE_29630 [Nannocystaceae bacterium ST9]